MFVNAKVLLWCDRKAYFDPTGEFESELTQLKLPTLNVYVS